MDTLSSYWTADGCGPPNILKSRYPFFSAAVLGAMVPRLVRYDLTPHRGRDPLRQNVFQDVLRKSTLTYNDAAFSPPDEPVAVVYTPQWRSEGNASHHFI